MSRFFSGPQLSPRTYRAISALATRNIKSVLPVLPINELALIQPTLEINKPIITYLHLHFPRALHPNPRLCLCPCVHLSVGVLGL